MHIEWIKLKGFRNFNVSKINFCKKTLIIGSNDVGKTNLLYAIRLLMDRTFSAVEIEPLESDFHIALDGSQVSEIEITIKLTDINEDALLSKLKGAVDDNGVTFLRYKAERNGLNFQIFIGYSLKSLEEIDSRSYLKHIHLRYIQSSRDLNHFIHSEKRHLIKIAKEVRDEDDVKTDQSNEASIKIKLTTINEDINKLSYIEDATQTLNNELKKLSHHHTDYSVKFESSSINFSTFIDQLSLGAKSHNRAVGLGGDGRNNQILVALWKAKSEREHDLSSEAVIYCVEEPEAHLHPHQQRKLAKYLIDELPGQVLVTTHSPQITIKFSPDSIVRLYEKKGKSCAASKGCSDCIDSAWKSMGYRMSIIPAEAFFADAVFLVEGPSEVLFYQELALQLKIDLDFNNISILSVDGIDFKVFVKILDAMRIPWVMRTDNDVFKVQRSDPPLWRFAGLNRALSIAGENEYENYCEETTPRDLVEEWTKESKVLNPKGVFIAKVDLENDIGDACEQVLKKYAATDDLVKAVKYLQSKKALRMGEFLSQHKVELEKLNDDDLAKPLHHIVKLALKK